MSRLISLAPEKRGQPATGHDTILTVALPQTVIDAVQDWADRNGVSQSEALRRLIETGLAGSSSQPQQSTCSIPVSQLNASNDV
jgi:hypothetical protein